MAKGQRHGAALTFEPLRQRLRKLPKTVAASVAGRAAPELTGFTQEAYNTFVDVYGKARPTGVGRKPLDLHDTGEAQRRLRFETDGGTVVRVHFGTPYTKYLVGKYRVLPNGPMPAKWRKAIDALVQQTRAPK